MDVVLAVVGILLLIPTLPVLLEFLFFVGIHVLGQPFRKPRTSDSAVAAAQRIAVLVPAHNEEWTIESCVKSLLQSETGPHHREVIVIADNCSDKTAEVARAAGARCLERNDLSVRGKGAALDYAFGLLASEPWDAYLIVDADTSVSSDFVRIMGDHFAAGEDALQCVYLVLNVGATSRVRLMNLALLSMNVFRPQSREWLGLSAGIFGNGFGLSRAILDKVPYTANSITEDLEYHLKLIGANCRVRFVSETRVLAAFPESSEGSSTQRARWEGGRFLLQRRFGPRLLGKVLTGHWRLVEPFLELMSLPLSFEVILLFALLFIPGFLWYSITGFFLIAAQTLLAVAYYGTKEDLKALLAVPGYLLWKAVSLPKILLTSRASATWTRTKRDEARNHEHP